MPTERKLIPRPGETSVIKLWRLCAFFFYSAIFRHTPENYRFYALFFPQLRNWLVKEFITTCGDKIRVKSGADVSPNISVGYESELGTRCMIQSHVTIGDHVIMGPDVKIYSKNHLHERLDIPMQKQGERVYQTKIGNDIWIGANVIILPDRTIGNHAILAAGAVITEDVPEFASVGGNPARILKYRDVSE